MKAGVVVIGSIVAIFDREFEEKNTYCVVSGKKEKDGELSFDSLLGQALMGKKIGDIVTVKAEEEYEIEIIDIDNSNVKVNATVSPTKHINQGQANVLARNLYKGYGGKAQIIYDECCKRFGWDYTKRGLFAPQKPLYAPGATPEGYSPLFLAHSNWTDSKGSNWTNTITSTTIEERWDTVGYDFYHDNYTRVVFAKSKSCNWNYVFIGVYKPVGYRVEKLPNGTIRWIKIFERISDEYGSTYVKLAPPQIDKLR